LFVFKNTVLFCREFSADKEFIMLKNIDFFLF